MVGANQVLHHPHPATTRVALIYILVVFRLTSYLLQQGDPVRVYVAHAVLPRSLSGPNRDCKTQMLLETKK